MILSQPLFLIALVAIALPIAVHLFNFRRYKKVYFSNVEYLHELQTETKKQSKLREYLILATRILSIVFLVLAFCQPVIPNKESPIKGGGSVVSVYVDNSFSMENSGNDGSLIESAKQKAREIAAAYQPSDQFQLLTNDMEGSQFRWVSRDEFLTLIDEIAPTAAAPLMSAIATRQQDFLRSSTAPNRFAYLISDFQSTTADFEHYPSDSLVLTTLVPLASVGMDNLSIDSVAIETPVAMQGTALTALVEVANHGDKAIDDLPVKLFVDNKERAIATVSLPAHATERVPLSFTINHSGMLLCRAEIEDYPITFDDRFYFSVNVMERLSVLCVEGRPQPNISQLLSGDSLIDYHTCGDRNIDFNRLGSHSLIILNELHTIPSGLAQTLATFVEQGGSLLVVPAEEAAVESYNQMLRQVHAPLLADYKRGTAKVSSLNAEAALYRGVFSGKTDASLELPTTQAHYKTLSDATTVAEVAMGYPTGDIFLSATQYGAGQLYLFTSPLRQEATDFVQQALFVPTLFNMALYAKPIGPLYTTIDNVSPVALPALLMAEEGSWRLTAEGSAFEVIPDLRTQGGRTYYHPHSQVREAGHYQLSQGKQPPLCALSFNYSRRESDMRFLSRQEVELRVEDCHLSAVSVVRQAEKPLDQYIRERHDARPLWRWCIALCLLMLVAETALLRWPKKKNRHSHASS